MTSLHDAAPSRSASVTVVQKLTEFYRWEGFRQALRVALAMVIAYYISLSVGWDRPQWAGLAVALCSLATTGDSINKGLLRILGTFLAGVVAITLAAMFPQDRWAYLTAASLYIAFCSYMMGSTPRWYFWFIGGYVMALLAMAGGPEGSTLFEVIVLRLQQTTMGLVVYLVVSSLLWPVRAEPALNAAATRVVGAERTLVADCRARLAGTQTQDAAADRRVEAAQAIAALPAVQDGAEVDSFDVWDKRRQWRAFVRDIAALDNLLETMRQTIGDLGQGDAATLASGLDSALEEIDARLGQIQRMLDGSSPDRDPRAIGDLVAGDALGGLDQFDRAAVLVALDLIDKVDRLTRRLFDLVADIRGFAGRTMPAEDLGTRRAFASALDPDRLSAALRTFVSVWLVLFACIYIPDLPMPAGVVPMVAAVAIQLSVLPAMSLASVVLPGLGATALGWAFHVLLMPHLHSYVGLGAGIFIVIFLVMILMAKPERAIGRPIVTSFFVMVASIQTEQTYNAIFAMNYGIAFSLALVMVWLAGLFPVSFRPQPALLGRLRRFFTSARRLTESMSFLGADAVQTRGQAFDVDEVRRLPSKIRPWLGRQPAVTEGRVERRRLDALTDALDMLSLRLLHLVDLRSERQATALRSQLQEDVRGWRLAIEDIFDTLAWDPERVDAASLRERLDTKLAQLTERIETTLDRLPAQAVSTQDLTNMFRLLGAYRGLSEAIVVVAQRSGEIDWSQIREERF